MPAIDHFNSTEIQVKSQKIIPISRNYAKNFKDVYFDYMFKKGNPDDD